MTKDRPYAGAIVPISVNGQVISFRRRRTPEQWWAEHGKKVLAAVATGAVLALLLVPNPAFAWGLEDLFKGIGDALLQTGLNLYNMGFSLIYHAAATGPLFNADFEDLFGLGNQVTFQTIENISKGTVMTLASTSFSLVLLLRLLKVAQRMDTNGTIPTVKEVLGIFVFAAFGVYVVGNGFGLAKDFYTIILSLTKSLTVGANNTIVFLVADSEGLQLGFIITTSLVCLILWLGTAITAAVMSAMFIARGIQLYLYALFAPLMLSFLFVDDLKQWALGYIKGYLAAGLSGFVMIFALTIFPTLLSGVFSGAHLTDYGSLSGNALEAAKAITEVYMTGIDATPSWVVVTGLQDINFGWEVLPICFALTLIILGSGKYAREIIGG